MSNNEIRRKVLSFIHSEVAENADAAETRRQNATDNGNENFQAGQVKAYRDMVARLDSLIDLIDLDESL